VLGLSGARTVWKSAQRMHFKFAFYRFLRWSPFRPGTTPSRWAKSRTLLRVYSPPLPQNLDPPTSKRRFQVDFPSLGRDCHHTVDLPINLHVHRSEGELPSRKHSRFEVRCFSNPKSRVLMRFFPQLSRAYCRVLLRTTAHWRKQQ
jgi:hypothetical protein